MSQLFFFTNGTTPTPPSHASPELDTFVVNSNVVFLTSLACYGCVFWEVILRSSHDFNRIYRPFFRAAREERRGKLCPITCFTVARILPCFCAVGIWGFYNQTSHCQTWARLLLICTLVPSMVMHLILVTRIVQLTKPHWVFQAYIWLLVAGFFGLGLAYAAVVAVET